MDTEIRSLEPEDWSAVAEIYRQGIASGHATFETRVPTWAEWDAARDPRCRLVAVDDAGGVTGFAVLSRASSRPVYAGVCEVMVYVAARVRGRGVGRALMDALVVASEDAGIWTLRAGIFPENEASIALHRAVGFRLVGHHERLGRFHDGRWRDVVVLERRSDTVGRE